MELSQQLAARFDTLQNLYPFKRSALIPMMMYAQDEYGYLSDEMIAEIARRLDLRTVAVEETLAYYSMLRRKPMGKHHVQICTNVACMLRGGNELLEQSKKRLEIGHKETTTDGVFSLEEVECIGACTGAPAMQVNYDFYENLTPMKFDRIIEELDAGDHPAPEPVTAGALHPRDPAETPVISRRFGIRNSHKIDVYLQNDGYKALEKALKEMTPETIIAGRAIGAKMGFIYIRGEYRYVLDIVQGAVDEAYSRNYLGKNIHGSGFDFDLVVHTGAGAYECGEESALMESLEGKRGYPRIKPPFPAVVGLYGCPTIINNVETLSTVPAIILEGGEKYASRGTPKNGGTRMLCVAGHLNKPGIYEVPLGMNMKKFIYETAGGIPNGKKLKAVIPGGSSCPLMSASEIDLPMDYDSVAKAGSMLGSGGMVVMDEDTCMVDMARRIMHFYAHESCGWCIPCREGTTWLRKMLERFHAGFGRPEDIDLVGDLAKNMLGRTFCPLGDAAALPTISIVQKWRNEFEQHLTGRCPFKSAEALVGSR